MVQKSGSKSRARVFFGLAALACLGILVFLISRKPTGVQQTEADAQKNNPAGSATLRNITFTCNWFPQAEMGGFYAAKALGIYEKYGMNVTLKPGNAQLNGPQLLMSGGTDFFMGSGFEALKAIEEGLPLVTVAALFQKDPQVLIAHPGVGNDSLEQLKGKPIFVSSSALTSFWPFLQSKFGYTDDQRRPYNFNIAPFLADSQVVQQGYLTSEPFTIEAQGKVKPNVFLLADFGYLPYATTIETTKKLVDSDSELVQKFVDASSLGWAAYLQNPEQANALIRAENPEQSEALMAYALQKMQELGIVNSGDAAEHGIGYMTKERWQGFFQLMSSAGVLKSSTNYEEAFTLKFVQNLPTAKKLAQ